MQEQNISEADIAIVGISCRLPGSKNASEFWQNLSNGKDCVESFTAEEMRAALINVLGYVPPHFESWMNDPNFVGVGAAIDDIDLFDAEFFGFNTYEAERLDPQQRIFLECAWSALEDAGYVPETPGILIGIYAGAGMSSYHQLPILPFQREIVAEIGNSNDYVATHASYKLNLKGPSLNIQSACSTSLVAVHEACQSLRSGECDIALAGGVIAYLVQKMGYLYQEGGIFSPDGTCYSFDSRARGTLFANGGVGIVVLKRLVEAIADSDTIYAVIKSSAINNDGSVKTGYTAPSIAGQLRVLSEALAIAEIDPASISYIEAHGTATPLGDPIEVSALTQAFRKSTQRNNFCALGTVKSNIGHLGPASGVAGLIKTSLALQHKMLPPSLHYEQPNPQIDFANSPFYVNTTLSPWHTEALPRRAGVSSFGMGGTNAHVILEETPQIERRNISRPWQLLTLSAKTPSALETMTQNLIQHLKTYPTISLPDAAFTLQVGRKAFAHRRIAVCRIVDEAIEQLEEKQTLTANIPPKAPSVVFMFSGQGTQYIHMGEELYRYEPVFRKYIDTCAEFLLPLLKCDIRELMYPSKMREEEARLLLNQTYITQPALFVIEYALSQLWMSWNVQPHALIGHSIGEYVAACLASVFSLQDALTLVATRGRLMQELPPGSMLTISLPGKDVQALLVSPLSLAAINGEKDCVVSGPTEKIGELEQLLNSRGVACHRLHTSHAFHSQMMDPILERFTAAVKKLSLKPPERPYISNVTGTWITAQEATSQHYWTTHLRQCVRFADGLQTLMADSNNLLLEVGPGRSLATFARRHSDSKTCLAVLTSLRHPQEQVADYAHLLHTCGQLWGYGQTIDWLAFHTEDQRGRVALPTYPFERKRYWIFPQMHSEPRATDTDKEKKPDVGDWFSIPSWKRSLLPTMVYRKETEQNACWIIFADTIGLGRRIAQRLEQDNDDAVIVLIGKQFNRVQDRVYELRPDAKEDYHSLLQDLFEQDLQPTLVAHLWTILPTNQIQMEIESYDAVQALSFYSMLYLGQSWGEHHSSYPLQLIVLTNNLQEVLGGEVSSPVRATVLGPGKVIPYEYPHITCRNIDIELATATAISDLLVEQIYAELRNASPNDTNVAYRDRHRWLQTIEAVPVGEVINSQLPLRKHGIYLITGGLGGIGFTLAKYLAQAVQATLILTGRTEFPPREEWTHYLSKHNSDSMMRHKIRELQQIEEHGARVLIAQADVADLAQMQTVVDQVCQHFGPLHGVIHAAGIAGGGMIHLKKPEIAANVLRPKVQGTLILEKVTKGMQLDFMILCSSLYSITGGLGQVDYCSANTFLDSFAFYHTEKNNTRTIAINWDAWQDVGMRMKTKKHPIEHSAPTLPYTEEVYINHPLFTSFRREHSDNIVFTAYLEVSRHWFLDEHRVKGQSIVSGTTFLEMIRAAFAIATQHENMEMQDVFFYKPLKVEENKICEARLTLKNEGRYYSFLISARTKTDAPIDVSWQTYVDGKIIPISSQQDIAVTDISALKAQIGMKRSFEDAAKSHQEIIQFGPRWNSLQEVGYQGQKALAVLELTSYFMEDLEKFYLHPALLDTAVSFAAHHHVGPAKDNTNYLQFSYQRLRINGPLPGRCVSYATLRAELPEELMYDIVIMNEYGQTIVKIDGLCLRNFNLDRLFSHPSPTQVTYNLAKKREDIQQKEEIPTTFGEGPIGMQNGILPGEGVEVFKRVLSRIHTPQIIVSATDLQLVFKYLKDYSFSSQGQNIRKEETRSLQQRPNIGAAYVAPRNETEQQIAHIWQQILGIDRIGIHDNFLEIGGDSVLNVQIISRLRNTFEVTLPMDLLFHTQTIEKIAEVIMEKRLEALGDVQITELLHAVSQMSDEEAMQLLEGQFTNKEREK